MRFANHSVLTAALSQEQEYLNQTKRITDVSTQHVATERINAAIHNAWRTAV
jgi:hypothetical protein